MAKKQTVKKATKPKMTPSTAPSAEFPMVGGERIQPATVPETEAPSATVAACVAPPRPDPDAPDKGRPYPSALHGWSAHPEIGGGK